MKLEMTMLHEGFLLSSEKNNLLGRPNGVQGKPRFQY